MYRERFPPDPNRARQRAIKRVLRLNVKKKLSGKPRGQKWIKAKQAECGLYGHDEMPLTSGLSGVCFYCGAKI